jgi:hypothetical protein
MVTLTGSPFKGNQLKAEMGKIVHFWLLVGGHHPEGRKGSMDDSGSGLTWNAPPGRCLDVKYCPSCAGEGLFLMSEITLYEGGLFLIREVPLAGVWT